tara:strand:+ start:2815 stop:3624 length:810 start_codon:yes stop_codon:yes gene_type:complete
VSYKSDVPILVNYQGAHDSNFPSFPLGTERSHNYSEAKGVFLYIYDDNAEYAVGLKAFLTDFSIDFTFDTEEVESGISSTTRVKSLGIKYNVGITLPAISLNDARVNTARIDGLQNMINKVKRENQGQQIESIELQYILLSNLINNGDYSKLIDVKQSSTIIEYGIPGYITEFNANIEDDMGYFEFDGRLWPKVYSISFVIIVQTIVPEEDSDQTKLIVDSYIPDTIESQTIPLLPGEMGPPMTQETVTSAKINPSEKAGGKWPFGVKI